jgi:hypothetical protein
LASPVAQQPPSLPLPCLHGTLSNHQRSEIRPEFCSPPLCGQDGESSDWPHQLRSSLRASRSPASMAPYLAIRGQSEIKPEFCSPSCCCGQGGESWHWPRQQRSSLLASRSPASMAPCTVPYPVLNRGISITSNENLLVELYIYVCN